MLGIDEGPGILPPGPSGVLMDTCSEIFIDHGQCLVTGRTSSDLGVKEV